MASSTMLQMKGRKVHCRQDYDDHPDHVAITERLRKTLYFGKTPQFDRPSLPLTELAVEICQDAAQRELGRVDTYMASSMGRRACMSPCSMVLGLLYIERLKKKNPNYLRRVSSSDLFLISMMMASKYVYDEGVDEEVFNDEWAESARMDVDEVNELEMDFLSAMDWGLFVKPEDFQTVLHNIEKRIALGQGIDRNWFSYTDLWVLFQDPKYQPLWADIGNDLGKVLLACSFTYVASVLAMIGSVIALSYVSAGISLVTPVLLPWMTVSIGQLSLVPKGPVALPEHDTISWSNMAAEPNTVNSSLSLEDVLEEPVTEGMKSASQETSTNPMKVADRSTFSSVLPPLLAVMTLKNTLMNFVSAVSDSRADNPVTHSQLSPMSCRAGFCTAHTDSDSNCWNVTTPESKPASSGAHPCCGHCRRNHGAKLNNYKPFHMCHKATAEKNIKLSGLTEFRCCCRRQAGVVWDPLSIQKDLFPDISLGFQTRTLTPLVANT